MDSQDDDDEKEQNTMEQGQIDSDSTKEEEPPKSTTNDEEVQPQQQQHNESTGTNFTENSHEDPALRQGHVYAIPMDLLDPPMTHREQFRDWVLRLLDRPFFQVMGLIVMFLVVADGAVFFFFLMGWQTVCDTPSKTNCSPRNEIYNVSVQLLNWLFTYMATVSMPWRCANFIQIFYCGKRDNSKGLDLYGRPSNEVWFHIDWCNRAGIIICLVLNCLLQYANQCTRLIFYNYELQDTPPGVYWVNIFFASSFFMAGIGAVWSMICGERLRKQHPGRFGPGALTNVRKYCGKCWTWIRCRPQEPEEDSEEELDEYEEELRHAEEEDDEDDPTHYPFNVLGVQRAGLRLFGM